MCYWTNCNRGTHTEWHGYVSAVLQFSNWWNYYMCLLYCSLVTDGIIICNKQTKTKQIKIRKTSLLHVQKLAGFDGCWLRFPTQVQQMLKHLLLTCYHYSAPYGTSLDCPLLTCCHYSAPCGTSLDRPLLTCCHYSAPYGTSLDRPLLTCCHYSAPYGI